MFCPNCGADSQTAFCLCIAGWQLSSFVVGLKLRSRLKRAQAGKQDDSSLAEPEASLALPPADMSNFVRAQSVTENTTELLKPLRDSADNRSKSQ
jgi:hypothetical protein